MAAPPIALLILVVVLAGRFAPPFESPVAETDGVEVVPAEGMSLIEAPVTRIIDASTLETRILGNRAGVKYLGVWTPAVTQRCGPEAEARNRELTGIRVLLEEDPGYRFDSSGSLLYYAYTPEGLSIDAVLVREGLALAVRPDARHGAVLAALQAEAEAAGRGCLWSVADGA
jgi:endonuclease YncB( thermonuclease family)